MAQFTIILVTNHTEVILTDYDARNNKISGHTFNENLQLGVDSKQLSFSMLKYNYTNGSKVLNPLATTITKGSLIKLYTNNQEYHFLVQDRNYTVTANNVQVDYVATDRLQSELSFINIGYSISADLNDPTYPGALPIDTWARRIANECNIPYTYIDIDEANANLLQLSGETSWNDLISFSVSNSNAYSALKSLADQCEMLLNVDFNTSRIWFSPQKNPLFAGFNYNPTTNLMQFSLNNNGGQMATVLNITGPKDYTGQEIKLVRTIPAHLAELIYAAPESGETQNQWEQSTWYAGLYDQLYEGHTINEEDREFLSVAKYVPWLENKLISLDYLKNTHLITDQEYDDIYDRLNNKLRKINAPLILASKDYLVKQEQDYMAFNQLRIKLDTYNAKALSELEEYQTHLRDNTTITDNTAFSWDISDITSDSIAGYDKILNEWIIDWDKYYVLLCQELHAFELQFHSSNMAYYIENRASSDEGVIQKCAAIAAAATEHWVIAYQCASKLGLYLPESWNCFDEMDLHAERIDYLATLPIIEKSGVPQTDDITCCKISSVTYYQLNPKYIPHMAPVSSGSQYYQSFKFYSDYNIDVINYTESTTITSNHYARPTSADMQLGHELVRFYCDTNGAYNTVEPLYVMNVSQMPEKNYLPQTTWVGEPIEQIWNSTATGYFHDYATVCKMFGKSIINAQSHPLNVFVSLAKNEYNAQNYRDKMIEHNRFWLQLYADYPGVLTESTYTNTDASSSEELYNAAKNQLEVASRPQVSYNLTGLDLQSIAKQGVNTLKLGDQIHINYSIDTYENDELARMISEPLYITNISHLLRSDGDYQFQVVTTKATDILMRRLARILNFDR